MLLEYFFWSAILETLASMPMLRALLRAFSPSVSLDADGYTSYQLSRLASTVVFIGSDRSSTSN